LSVVFRFLPTLAQTLLPGFSIDVAAFRSWVLQRRSCNPEFVWQAQTANGSDVPKRRVSPVSSTAQEKWVLDTIIVTHRWGYRQGYPGATSASSARLHRARIFAIWCNETAGPAVYPLWDARAHQAGFRIDTEIAKCCREMEGHVSWAVAALAREPLQVGGSLSPLYSYSLL